MSVNETTSMSATEIVAEMREQQDWPELKETSRMKIIQDETNDSQTYRRARKQVLANSEGLCSFCRYHKGENARKKQRNGRNKKKYKTVSK